MKKILIISDSHGNIEGLKELESKMEKVDYIFHLGDHDYDMDEFRNKFDLKIYSVKGNCDGGGEEYVFNNDGVKILLVHGDRYHVKMSLLRLSLRAKELGVNAVCFGHTHNPLLLEEDGILFINPGALKRGLNSFAYAEIDDNGRITAQIKRLGENYENL